MELTSTLLFALALYLPVVRPPAADLPAPPAADPPVARLSSGERVVVPAGTYRPLFTGDNEPSASAVPSFQLDVRPVTNSEFLAFVRAQPEWRRDHVSRLFADTRYLAHWSAPDALGDARSEAPVTHVSWFAAKAFCAANDGRLPSEAEWEYAAAASPRHADGRRDPEWSAEILAWYAKPSAGPRRDVGQGPPNFYGVRDLHGLTWEWVLDFNSSLVTSDSRRGGDTDRNTFCGAGALAANEPENYASFMRVALRSSLEAPRVLGHLGFRCAYDVQPRSIP